MALFDGPQPSPSPGQAPRTKEDAAKAWGEALAGNQQTGATAKDPPVFMGWMNNPIAGQRPSGPTGPLAPGYTPSTIGNFATTQPNRIIQTGTVSQVAGQYYSWDQATKDRFMAHAELAGYDTRNMKDGQLAGLWGSYVQQAASYYAQGQNVSPWDIMTKDGKQREAYMNKPRTVTQTSTAYDLSTEGDARSIFYTAAQQLLGRDPTKSETRSFQAALNKMERANPTVTTQTSNYVGDTLQSQTSTTKGGVKEGARQMEAMDQAKADPEYGAYQAATTYFDAMMQMLGGMN